MEIIPQNKQGFNNFSQAQMSNYISCNLKSQIWVLYGLNLGKNERR